MILEALRNKMFPEPAHVMLTEVRNTTGYSKSSIRYADALVLSTWPSRGIWLAGIEVKSYRNDFLSEIRKPEKSSEIQKYCDYWWMACLPGIALEHEIPEKWGLVYVDNATKIRVIKKAPALKPKALDKVFVASILRKFAGNRDKLIAEGRELEAKNLLDRESKVAEKDIEINTLKSTVRTLETYLEDARIAQERDLKMQKEFGIGFPFNDYDAGILRRAISFARIGTKDIRRMSESFRNIFELSSALAEEIEKAARKE